MKMCGRCKQEKSLSDFTPSAHLRSGAWCKPCFRIYNRGWKERNPEKYREHYTLANRKRLSDPVRRRRAYDWAIRWNQALKAAAFRALGDRCACCGEDEPAFLQIDHIANNGAAHRKRLGIATRSGTSKQYLLYKEVASGKTEGLQLLCANCNWGKARNDGICPHEEERMASALLSA